MRRAEMARMLREKEARRRRAAQLEYQRRLEREAYMRELLRQRELQYERAREMQRLKEEEALRRALRHQQRRHRREEEYLSADESFHDAQEETSSVESFENAVSATVPQTLHQEQTQSSRQKLSEVVSQSRGTKIVVEDASDSEGEEEILTSPWRNRRPSPGQWMEPVELQ